MGQHEVPAGLVDGSEEEVLLSGPTNLVYVEGTGLVLFTDRNPAYMTGAVRVWDVNLRLVQTVAGSAGGERGTEDGNVETTGKVGAAWGLDYCGFSPAGDSANVVWTEGDFPSSRAAVRRSGGAVDDRGRLMSWCQRGFYYNSSVGKCVECLAGAKPLHDTVFITQGLPDQNMSCRWECPWDVYLPSTCPEFSEDLRSRAGRFAADGDGGRRLSLATNAGLEEVVVCGKGWELNTENNRTSCTACSRGFYCDGTNSNRVGRQRCSNSSLEGAWKRGATRSQDCCPPNHFCTEEEEKRPCPDVNMVSPAGTRKARRQDVVFRTSVHTTCAPFLVACFRLQCQVEQGQVYLRCP